ncbi:U-box domain-containing protein 9-like isoform X1 [Salvia hispanica]|uniref:U-box domain-containing protein 9-like isoform X1 n=2 Tax=Salvia hispanica TaxID=49212 RepID=UPI002009CE3B|nr:U-box domain-containing protein 9-like isoform X1 [Salvia hispanica]
MNAEGAVTPLIPNLVIRDMISSWCRNRAITTYDNNEGEDYVEDLVCALREAKDEDVRKSTIGIFKNICVDDKVNKRVGEASDAIVDATRRGSGSQELRMLAVATLNILATLESNKLLIVRCGVFWHLTDLLQSQKETEATEAAQLIQKLCTVPSNKVRAVDEDLIQVLMGAIDHYVFEDTYPVVVDIILDVLKLLVHESSARYKMEELDGVHWLFQNIDYTANPLTKEHCVAILDTALFADEYVSSWGVAMYNEETKYRTLARLVEQGTPAAQSMASILLNKLNTEYPYVRVFSFNKHTCYYDFRNR